MPSSFSTRVESWEECQQQLLKIESDNKKSLGGVWFRGHSNACWRLATTLERRNSSAYFIDDYWNLMIKIKPEVEAMTGRTWEVPPWSEPDWPFEVHFLKNKGLGYMAHLRHHGFPSPLLDWSRSPYIAAYFAFAELGQANEAAIYAFSEVPNNAKSGSALGPKIVGHGGFNLRTHARHFRQQSSYTVCVEQEQPSGRWKFVSHERVFDLNKRGQDRLYKITIPSRERARALAHLDKYNLNGFSLFGSEESLMNTLAIRRIDLAGTGPDD